MCFRRSYCCFKRARRSFKLLMTPSSLGGAGGLSVPFPKFFGDPKRANLAAGDSNRVRRGLVTFDAPEDFMGVPSSAVAPLFSSSSCWWGVPNIWDLRAKSFVR